MMDLFYNDYEKRFLTALQPACPKRMTESEVIKEIAQIWVDSGGDSGGLDALYVQQIKDEIDNLKGAA